MLIPWVILVIEDDNDREFMEKLYVHHYKMMYRVARASTESVQEAEDAVSDACVSLIKVIDDLKRFESNVLEGYIVSTVKNAAYSLYRKKKVRKEVSTSDDFHTNSMEDEHTPDEGVLWECTIAELMEAMEKLSDADQTAVRMKYFQNSTDEEIANILGVQAITVRSRLTRARNLMCSMVKDEANKNQKRKYRYTSYRGRPV